MKPRYYRANSIYDTSNNAQPQARELPLSSHIRTYRELGVGSAQDGGQITGIASQLARDQVARVQYVASLTYRVVR